MSFMNSQNLFEKDMVNLKKQFEACDEDNNGSLTINEVKKSLTLVLSSTDIEGLEKAIEELDTDKSGKIDYTEFINLTVEKKKYL